MRLIRLARKELSEILRDRRTITTLVLMPLLLYPILGVAFRQHVLLQLGGLQASPTYRLGFENEDDAKWFLSYLGSSGAEPAPGPKLEAFIADDLRQNLRDAKFHVGVRIVGPSGRRFPHRDPYGHDLAERVELVILEGHAVAMDALRWVRKRLGDANVHFLKHRLERLGVSQPAVPVQADVITIVDPDAEAPVSLAALVPLVLILMTITGAVYPAIDLTAGERERGTLEVLVAAPIPRLGLLLAKYVAVFAVSVLTALVNFAAMALTVQLSGLGPLVFGLGGGLTFAVMLQVFALLLLFSAFFSAVLLCLTSFARSFKEAQAYLIPLMMAALGPGMMSMSPGLKLSPLVAITPLLNIVLLSRDLLEAKPVAEWAIVVVVATMLYAAAALSLAARVFGAEAVLYSETSGWGDLFRRPTRPSAIPAPASAWTCLAVLFPANFVVSGLLREAQIVNPSLRLVCVAVATAVLFAGVPLIAAWLGRVELRSGLQLRTALPSAFLAATLLGLSLWPWAYQAIVWMERAGFAALSTELVEKARELAASWHETPTVLVVLALAVVPAICEELFFRGYLFAALRPRGGTSAIVITGVAFGVFHLLSPEAILVERFVPTTLLGFVLGWVALRTGSVVPGMVLHACHNGLLVTLAAQAETIERWGWGTSDRQLPASWLAASVVGTIIGLFLLHTSTRNHGK
jgi:ABC-2 type transport system permease protein/sodium transport system permease protein